MSTPAPRRASHDVVAVALLAPGRLPSRARLAAPPPAAEPSGEQQRATLTVAETAQLLGVSPWLIHQQIARGTLPYLRLGRRILISRTRLVAWLETDH
ncbi:MAG: helix-turn-helix domain-containing protein [Actinomycetota bacterium]|nr:helix-turn-helix domain-containing protein [Actinomycetota bacterium]